MCGIVVVGVTFLPNGDISITTRVCGTKRIKQLSNYQAKESLLVAKLVKLLGILLLILGCSSFLLRRSIDGSYR